MTRLNLSLVTAPLAEPVTVAEAKRWAEIEDSDWDTLIGEMIATAREKIDARGSLGRALCRQTWDFKLDGFPGRIILPFPPLASVTSITYVDSAGDSQSLASSVYQVLGVGAHNGGSIVEAYDQSWPETRAQPEAVTVRFVCGYAPGSASPVDHAENVPSPIKTAIKMTVAHWFRFRDVASERAMTEIPEQARALLANYRAQVLM